MDLRSRFFAVASTKNVSKSIFREKNSKFIQKRSMSTAEIDSGAPVILNQMERTWSEGKIIEAEHTLQFALESFPQNPQVLLHAISLKDLVGSVQDQDHILQQIQSTFSSGQVTSESALIALLEYLVTSAYVLAKMGVNSLALKRLDIAQFGSNLIKNTSFAAQSSSVSHELIATRLKEQQNMIKAGKSDSIIRTPPIKGFTSCLWEAKHDIRTGEKNFQTLLRSAKLNQSVGMCPF